MTPDIPVPEIGDQQMGRNPEQLVDEILNTIESSQIPNEEGAEERAAEQARKDLPPATNGTVLDEMQLDEPLFDSGPSRREVEELKKKYPNSSIMCTLMPDGTGYIYRTLTRNEWRGLQTILRPMSDPDKKEELIFSKVVLHPNVADTTKIGDLPAGVVTTVLNEFYMSSGFQPVAESLKL